jgi:iron-sulfur cluster repair protein YtfE (RIC family)
MPTRTLPLARTTPDTRVEEALFQLPAAPGVFARYGLDGCCSGRLSLRDAAARAAVPLATLLAELGVPT